MGLDQPLTDPWRLAIHCGGNRALPLVALHPLIVAQKSQSVPELVQLSQDAMLVPVSPVDPLRRLLAAAAEGDNVAVAELVRLTQDRVLRLCHSLGSPGEEEDLAQETYLRALRSLHTYRGDAPAQVWLLSIARHVCADHVRRRQRQRRLVDRISRLTTAPSAPTHQHLDDLLDVLDGDRREAFVLTQLVGLSYEEAAAVMETPIGTVRSRVARARAELMVAAQQQEAM